MQSQNPELSWYCVRTFGRRESAAAESVRAIGREFLFPQVLKSRLRGRQYEDLAEPLFPTYIFGRIDLAEDLPRLRRLGPWTVAARGVVKGHLGSPIVVPEAVIEEIRLRTGTNGFVRLGGVFESMAQGTPLELAREGVFYGRMVMFEEYLKGTDRVAILLDMLGRQVRQVVEPGELRLPAYA